MDRVHEEAWPLRFLGRMLDILLIVAGGLIVILMFGNVLSRFFFNFDVAWTTELTGFLMVWATFLGGAAAAQRRAHMRVGELLGMLNDTPRQIAEIIIASLVSAVLVALVWFGWSIAAGNMDQTSSVLYYPIGLQYAALPVGSALALFYVARDIVRLARGERVVEASVEL